MRGDHPQGLGDPSTVSRIAAGCGFLLAGLTLYRGVGAGPGGLLGVAGGVLLATSAWWTLRGGRWAPIALGALALSALAEALPGYFGSYRVWPLLPSILLASLTFGLGLLGVLLDRHPGRADRDPRL